MLNRVERHIFINRKDLDNLCFKAKNLYNYVLYFLRLSFFITGKLPGEYIFSKWLAGENQYDYRQLPPQTSQQIIKVIYMAWKSFLKAVQDYKKNPKKYKSKPKLPKYKSKKNGRNIVIFTNQQIRLKNGYIHFPKSTMLMPLKTNVDNINQVRIIPQQSCYVIEVVYRSYKDNKKHNLNENLYLGVDLGIDNFATLVTNLAEKPVLVNGKIVKSVNQHYNKIKAKLMSNIGSKGDSNGLKKITHSRNMIIQNYLHCTSRFIVNYCLKHRIKNIVIGYNPTWKQNVEIGKVNNQNFVSVPFLKLINQIQYKAEEYGIKIKTIEESYTSKVDALSLETIEKHDKYNGKRKHRGLFQSSVGMLVNADVNGALNILRKVIGNSFVKEILDKRRALRPVKVNPLQCF